MKKLTNIALLLICFLTLMLVVGCTEEKPTENSNVIIEEYSNTENSYQEYKEINNQEKALKIKNILNNTKWENKVVDMERQADFTISFKDENTSSPEKLYEIWISPSKNKLEVFNQESGFAQLNRDKSSELFEAITGDKLQK